MSKLKGQEIFIVENEPLIAMEIVQAFHGVGALVTSTGTLKQALTLVERDGLAVAILDHELADGDSSMLYERLRARGIPFIVYSGFANRSESVAGGMVVSKPATAGTLITATEGLLSPYPS
jgi:DNA-binding response OmpR family regulator